VLHTAADVFTHDERLGMSPLEPPQAFSNMEKSSTENVAGPGIF
jgi:hypothetical protein